MKRNVRKIELPKDFAEKLLESQIEYKLSDSPSKETVKNLIELYSQGVEYFESIRSHKYLYFQLKMNEIFTTASTMTAINEQQQEAVSPLRKKMKSSLEQEKIQALKIKQKQEKMFQQIAQNSSESATVNTVKKMINENDLKTLETKQKVKKQIENQDEKLKEKLQKRKSRLLFSKSFSGLMNENETQDTLFNDINGEIKIQFNDQSAIKPIEVSFNSIIKENESDDQELERIPRRRMSISQDPTKKNLKQLQTSMKINNSINQ